MYGSNCGVEDLPEVIIVTPGRNRSRSREFVKNIAAAESNELLNHNDIKMNDFERTDSEEDILEDYEGSECDLNVRCLRKRTCLEKCTFVFLIITFVIIIALAVALATKKTHSGKSLCETQDCIESANSILKSMDRTVDACKDFYQYACGGWMKNTPIPPGYKVWDRLQELSYTNLYQLRTLLEEEMNDSPGIKAKTFYHSCLYESKQKRQETVLDFIQLIHNISSDEDTWDFGAVLEQIHQVNSWPILKLVIGPDERNTKKNIIKIEFGETQIPFGMIQQSSQSSTGTTTGSPTFNATTTKKVKQNGDPSSKYLRWNETMVIKNFLEETVRILKVFWKYNDTTALNVSKELLELEQAIGKARGSMDHIHNRSHAYNAMTVSALQSKCDMLSWELYINAITMDTSGSVTKADDEIVVLHEDSLLKVCKIIDTYKNDAAKKRILRLYLLVNLARNFMPYFDARTFQDIEPDEEIEMEGEHWRRCVYYTNKALGFVTGAAYVHATSGIGSVKKIKELIKDVKLAFKNYLLRKVWISKETKQEASLKIDEMLDKISYPDYILDSKFLEKLYSTFNVGQDWFINVKEWQEFQVRSMVTRLSKTPNRKSWINPPVTVESDYSPVRNDIIFPIAMLHLPLYTPQGSEAFNFGAMGSVIGHEITHAFDILGRQYDGKGQLKEWWDKQTAKDFKTTTDCMKEQYDNFHLDGLPINGLKTLDENIADNGGLRAANIAYQIWERENGEDLPLPGVNLTNKQIFFVSYAQMFCSKWKHSGLVQHLIEDTHCPGPLRVKGSVSNSDAFSKAFQCPFVAEYNPSTKCRVW